MRKRRYEIYNPETKEEFIVKPSQIRKYLKCDNLHHITHTPMGDWIWFRGLRYKVVQ